MKWVDDLMGRLTIEQKVGQLMVFGFAGPIPNPMVKELITKYHVGGFRIAQKFHGGSSESRNPEDGLAYKLYDGKTFDVPADLQSKRVYCTSKEYAQTLNYLRDLALDRKDSVGLHFTYDQEGEGADFLFEQRIFPYPMGLVATGDTNIAYKVGLMAGKQARALGANMIHSPVLDVNTNPLNPEIGVRSYSPDPSVVAEYAIASLKGYSEAGIICTGKHYPGRGASVEDAHFSLPVIDLSRDELLNKHIAPYKKLINAGLPAIMAAFTAYPAFGSDNIPAATDKEIMTNLLRNELGFKGVVTTDNIQMRGLLNKYELSEAVIRCIEAGCDLMLFRSESPATIYVIEKVVEAVKSGRITEKRLDESVMRILTMRYNMGLHENGGKVNVSKAGELFEDEEVKSLANEAARKSIVVLKNKGLVPLTTDKKILLIEQVHHFHSFINNTYVHAGVLWEEMCKHSDNVSVMLIHEKYDENDKAAVLRRLSEEKYDLIVTTSYYNYRSHAIMIPLLEEISKFNIPTVVVSNTPYEKFGVPAFIENAVVSFAPSGRENITAIAETLFGKNRDAKTELTY